MKSLQHLLDLIEPIEPEEPKPDKDINLEAELKRYFGYDEFREGQKEIVKHLVNERNILASCPTAFGKSICYQLPALILDGLTIIISPLISLMKDQIDNLKKKGINSGSFINSTLSQDAIQKEYQRLQNKEVKLLYISPEKLASRQFCEILKRQEIALAIIDEAHCVSQWGHDFRPEYIRIKQTLSDWDIWPQAIGMFTATATDEVKNDIIEQTLPIGKLGAEIINHSIERKNLKYSVIKTETTHQKYQALSEIIETIQGKGIVYAGTRKKVEEVSKFIQTLNVTSDYYHAGRPQDEREEIQNSFFSDTGIQVIVATNAFGMGIDKEDIRFVIHWDMPGNLENYVQESGRAGRDGKQSLCVLLYKQGDEDLQKWFTKQSAPNADNLINTYNYIYNQKAIDNYRLFSSTDLSEELDITEDNVKLILSHLKKYNIIEWYNNVPSKLTIEVTTLETDETLSKLAQKENYDFHEVCEIFNSEPDYIYNSLSIYCEYGGSIKFRGKEDATLIEFSYDADDIETTINTNVAIDDYFERKNQKTEKHLEFIHTKGCRQKVVNEYFDETHTKDCGNCDNCNKHLQELDNNMLFAHLWLWAVDDEMKEKPKPKDLKGTYYEDEFDEFDGGTEVVVDENGNILQQETINANTGEPVEWEEDIF